MFVMLFDVLSIDAIVGVVAKHPFSNEPQSVYV
jgi:hypothetical protein